MRAEPEQSRAYRPASAVALTLAALIGSAGCSDREPRVPTDPSISQASSQQAPSRGRALERFPEMVAFLPAIRVATPENPLPPEPSDAELVREVSLAQGRVFIGFKLVSAPSTRETGVVPGLDRATALAGRAAVEVLGAVITTTYRHSTAVAATIPPELAPSCGGCRWLTTWRPVSPAECREPPSRRRTPAGA